MKKEAITHGVLEDLTNRNDNWEKLDGVPEKVDELMESKADKTYVDNQDAALTTQLAEKVQNFKLKNEIVNGDFSDGTTGWTLTNLTLQPFPSEINKSVLGIANNSVSTALQITNTDAGIYYVRTMCYLVSGGISIGIRVHDVSTTTDFNIDRGKIEQWQSISGVLSTSAGVDRVYLGGNGSRTYEAYFNDTILINLTQVFGAGNEPTKEAMDELMKVVPNQWWDGEHTLEQKEVVQWLLKLEAEKANKQQEAWITPTLLNGATGDAQYRINDFGVMEFRGNIKPTSGLPVFRLPLEYIQTQAKNFIVASETQKDFGIVRFPVGIDVYVTRPVVPTLVYLDVIKIYKEEQ